MVSNIFSKRNNPVINSGLFSYDINHFPSKLKNQVLLIIKDCFENQRKISGDAFQFYTYEKVITTLNHEYGISITSENQLLSIFLETTDIYFIYDFIELFFQNLESLILNNKQKSKLTQDEKIGILIAGYLHINIKKNIKEAIEELNIRFKESGVMYRYEARRIIRIPDNHSYSEILQPVLSLTSNKTYEGANNEFLSACEHYKYGRNKECLNDCLKAFESTMKCICLKRKWKFDDKKDTAIKLVTICLSNKLIPDYMQTQFGGLRSVLESGVPTIRNRESGHGQGKKIKTIDDHLASYVLNLTASNILLLINSEKVLSKK